MQHLLQPVDDDEKIGAIAGDLAMTGVCSALSFAFYKHSSVFFRGECN